MDRLEQAVSIAQRTGKLLGILFISLDRLKKVNDNLGHMTADHLMKQAAERLRSCVTAADTVARFAGDEFAVMLTQIDGAKDVVEIIGSITLCAAFSIRSRRAGTLHHHQRWRQPLSV
jgi:diguanylate cyclase (GGDEF)-like protein